MTKRLSEFKRSLTEELPATKFVGGFPRKHISVLASAPGTGKTWFVLKTAMDLSVGGTVFLGLAYNEPPSKSVIMCGEAGIEMLVERVNLLNKKYSEDLIAIYTIGDLMAEEVPICLDEKAGLDNLRKIIVGEEADIVFIDSLIAFRSDDENASKETARLLNSLIGIARKTNCAIVVTHHIRKRKRKDEGETTQDDIIGSSAITRLCATAWIMSREKNAAFVKLACVKSWWEKPAPIYWRISANEGGIYIVRATITDTEEGHKAVRSFLSTMPKEELIPMQDILDETSVDIAIVQSELSLLQKAGKGDIISASEGGYGIIMHEEREA